MSGGNRDTKLHDKRQSDPQGHFELPQINRDGKKYVQVSNVDKPPEY